MPIILPIDSGGGSGDGSTPSPAGGQTLLQLVNEFADRNGQPQVGAIFGTTDPGVRQYRGLMNELCDDFVTRAMWQWNIRETIITTGSTELIGSMFELAGPDYKGIVPRTFWDRTNSRPVEFINFEQLQVRKAANTAGPYNEVYLKQNNLYTWPAPTAGLVWACNFYSRHFVISNDGATTYRYWHADDDLWFSDDAIPLAWLSWKWLQKKGLDYAEEFAAYERLLQSFGGTDAPKPTLRLDNPEPVVRPGILVPSGSWNLP